MHVDDPSMVVLQTHPAGHDGQQPAASLHWPLQHSSSAWQGTLATPLQVPPQHVWLVGQSLHWSVPPHPSSMLLPHWPAWQVAGVQPQTLSVPPPPQVAWPVQRPHSSMPPQPSAIRPQFLPALAQVVGTQTQVFPPQRWLLVHVWHIAPFVPHA